MDSIVEQGADEEGVKEDVAATAAAAAKASAEETEGGGALIKPGQELALGFTVCTSSLSWLSRSF